MVGNRCEIPASTKAINSDTNCNVVAAASCNGAKPGLHTANNANSFRFQQMGNGMADGNVRAYGANVDGDPGGGMHFSVVAKAVC
mmetsp:Transcript_2220/g.3235  ORF Transcript_2220/g.3235 Transcript_2220/m.3235 type:complete len:85 (+) Transcript_2220:790-1044(+)